jgi:hypothetical protein
MDALIVDIEGGKEAYPAARLLECLTRCNLLSERVVWSENIGFVRLTIHNPTEKDEKVFGSKPHYKVRK